MPFVMSCWILRSQNISRSPKCLVAQWSYSQPIFVLATGPLLLHGLLNTFGPNSGRKGQCLANYFVASSILGHVWCSSEFSTWKLWLTQTKFAWCCAISSVKFATNFPNRCREQFNGGIAVLYASFLLFNYSDLCRFVLYVPLLSPCSPNSGMSIERFQSHRDVHLSVGLWPSCSQFDVLNHTRIHSSVLLFFCNREEVKPWPINVSLRIIGLIRELHSWLYGDISNRPSEWRTLKVQYTLIMEQLANPHPTYWCWMQLIPLNSNPHRDNRGPLLI